MLDMHLVFRDSRAVLVCVMLVCETWFHSWTRGYHAFELLCGLPRGRSALEYCLGWRYRVELC